MDLGRERLRALALGIAAAAGTATAAERLKLEEVCRVTACWPGGKVAVPAGDGDILELEFPKAPYYYDGFALVVSGQTLLLEATIRSGALELARVTAMREPKRTIVVTLEPSEGPGAKGGTLMKVTNPLDRPLAYSALVHRAVKDGALRPTSICPVIGGGGVGFEHWPYPVFRVALSKFAFAAADDHECRVR